MNFRTTEDDVLAILEVARELGGGSPGGRVKAERPDRVREDLLPAERRSSSASGT